MPTWAIAQTLSQPPKRTDVTRPPQAAWRNGTRQFGITQKTKAKAPVEDSKVKQRENTHESRIQMSPSETHFVSHVAPSVATRMSLTTRRIGRDMATVASNGKTIMIRRYMYARFQIGRGCATPKMPLKLVSTEASVEITVHRRKPKPIHPNVLMSNCSMRSKSWFEICRAVRANSSAAMRFFSRSFSSKTGSAVTRTSSCPFSMLTMSASIFPLIWSRANESMWHVFAATRMQQRIGTTDSST